MEHGSNEHVLTRINPKPMGVTFLLDPLYFGNRGENMVGNEHGSNDHVSTLINTKPIRVMLLLDPLYLVNNNRCLPP